MFSFGRDQLWIAAAAAVVLLAGASHAAADSAPPAPELVLQEHARLSALTSAGPLTVLAGSGIARSFAWQDCLLEAHMSARSARWMGSLGIYDPAPVQTQAAPRYVCHGISRTVAQEGQIHFADEAAALQWLRIYAVIRPSAWTSDGLVVQWSLAPERQQLNVDIWQICIAGRYPVRLDGAKDAAFSLTSSAGTPARRACASATAATVSETQKAWQRLWDLLE